MCAAPGDGYKSTVSFDSERIGAAAIYCSDGRYGEQFDEFLHHALGLPRYDRVAIPGGAACLAGHFAAYREEEAVLEQIRFLVDTHDLSRVVLIAHESCGFYSKWLRVPVTGLRERQAADLRSAGERIRSLHSRLDVSGFFAVRDGDAVRFERVQTV